MVEENLSKVLSLVAPRLRELRHRRGRTLRELAEETGISISTLSRLESGQRRPTLDLLLPLATAYHVPLDDLVGAPTTGDPRIHPRPVHRNGMIFIPLSRYAQGLQAFKIVLPGRTGGGQPEQGSHEGYEWLYVLDGRLRLVLGDRELVLESGEAAEFDTRTPHAVVSAGPVSVELLTLFSPQGERMHLRSA